MLWWLAGTGIWGLGGVGVCCLTIIRHNTTGTQCGVNLSINEGDTFRFRLRQTRANTTHVPDGLPGLPPVHGSEWTLTATRVPADNVRTNNVATGSARLPTKDAGAHLVTGSGSDQISDSDDIVVGVVFFESW
jgi:hypothetical protein